jgi:prepilin-type N-terminal cleavage/methylation domain-containing protein
MTTRLLRLAVMRVYKVTNQTLHPLTHPDDNDLRRAVARAHSGSGHSLIELLIVLALIGAVTSFALPQLVAERRLSRSVGITREILTQLRHTRQLAMSQRQAFTFQYDDVTKQISIIDHNDNPGAATLINGSYPNTANTRVVSAIPLAEASISSEISYGIPAGLPNGALGDGIALTPLVNNQLNITFQPDGSVIDPTGDPQSCAMFIYNDRAPEGTASAISIMGASGRVKIWRYSAGVSLYTD